jgi:hypothetical protein
MLNSKYQGRKSGIHLYIEGPATHFLSLQLVTLYLKGLVKIRVEGPSLTTPGRGLAV